MSGTASLTCTGAPIGANCSVPSNEAFSSDASSTFNLSVTTTPRAAGAIRPQLFRPVAWLWAVAMVGIVVIPEMFGSKQSLRRVHKLAPLTLLFLLSSCGGGSTGQQPNPNSNGTPPGTYNLNVKATATTTTQTIALTLIVQ